MPSFFIDRPIFAWVIAILITLAGGVAIFELPVSAYPPIAPPQISINAVYPGASAEVIEKTVTSVIEQQLTGVDNLLYFDSTSRSNGTVQITLTFISGTDPDIAQVQVQNRLSIAQPRLPQGSAGEWHHRRQGEQRLPHGGGAALERSKLQYLRPQQSDRLAGARSNPAPARRRQC